MKPIQPLLLSTIGNLPINRKSPEQAIPGYGEFEMLITNLPSEVPNGILESSGPCPDATPTGRDDVHRPRNTV